MLSGQVFPGLQSPVQKLEEAHRPLNPKETLFRSKGKVEIRHAASKHTQGPLLLLGLSQDGVQEVELVAKGLQVDSSLF